MGNCIRNLSGGVVLIAADDTWTADPATVEGDGYGDLELIVDSQSGAITSPDGVCPSYIRSHAAAITPAG